MIDIEYVIVKPILGDCASLTQIVRISSNVKMPLNMRPIETYKTLAEAKRGLHRIINEHRSELLEQRLALGKMKARDISDVMPDQFMGWVA